MTDKHIKEFDQIKTNFDSEKRKKNRTLSCARLLDTFDIKKARDILNKSDELSKSEKEYVLKISKRMLNANINSFGVCFGYYVMMGAEFCERLGLGKEPFVKKKLLTSFKKHPDLFDHQKLENFFYRTREDVVTFKNPFLRLFPKLNHLFVVAFIYFLLGLFILSGKITGYFVLGKETSYSNYLGAFLFLLGIAGFMLFFRKKSS